MNRISREIFFFPRQDLVWLGRNAFVLLIYWGILAYGYVAAVSPINSTAISFYVRVDDLKVAEGLVWALALLPSITTSWQRPSDYALTILYFIGLVPTLVIFGLADQSRSTMYVIIAGYIAVWGVCRLPLQLPQLRLTQRWSYSLFLAGVGSFATLGWFLLKGNPRNFNVDLAAVYDYRQAAVDLFGTGPLAYIAAWTPRVLLPFLMSYFLFKRRWFAFGLMFTFQLGCLIIFQEKSVLLPCVILPMLYFSPSGRWGRVWFIALLSLTVLAADLIYQLYGLIFAVQFWTRRFFFVQQFLYFNYFDVFSKIGYVYFSDSFGSIFIRYPFQQTPALMVAYYVLGADMNANTGFLGAGYMEMGPAGVILYGVVIGIVLKFFDQLTPRNMPMWLLGATAFLPFMAMLVEMNLPTSLLTGGVGLFGVLMLTTSERTLSSPTREMTILPGGNHNSSLGMPRSKLDNALPRDR